MDDPALSPLSPNRNDPQRRNTPSSLRSGLRDSSTPQRTTNADIHGRSHPGSPPSQSATAHADRNRWYLGIDIGGTGLSAVLLDRRHQRLHPISWYPTPKVEQGLQGQAFEPCFRLPTAMVLSPQPSGQEFEFVSGWAVTSREETASDTRPAIALRPLKPVLNLLIPHYSTQTQQWEPVLQDGGQVLGHARACPLPLSWFYQALKALLTTLSATSSSPLPIRSSSVGEPDPHPMVLQRHVWGLEQDQATAALAILAGVTVSYPAAWSAAYRFNVREALLGAGVVTRAAQITMVNDAIATLLSVLPSGDGTPITLPTMFDASALQPPSALSGPVLVINAGMTTTELAIATITPDAGPSSPYGSAAVPSSVEPGGPSPASISLNRLVFRSLAYGGEAMDQDIVGHVLYPRLAQVATAAYSSPSIPPPGAPDIALPADWWYTLALESLQFPSAGEPDPLYRHHLRQRLHRVADGALLMEQARMLKLILQRQPSLSIKIDRWRGTIRQDELEHRVFLPYAQRLQRDINALLAQANLSSQDIGHIVCSGGAASFRFLTQTLQQHFPYATLSQDVYHGDSTPIVRYNIVPTCSRVAYGLACLPLHATVVDWANRQPSDYDFLCELARVLPHQDVTLRDILRLLEQKGINPVTSQAAVLSLLRGKLPSGLVPTAVDMELLSPQSQGLELYRRLRAAPLFTPVDDQTYRPNRTQWLLLQQYLSLLLVGNRQTAFQPHVGMAVQ